VSFFDDQQGGGPAAAALKLHQIGNSFAGVIEHISTGYKSKYNANPNAQRENELGPDGKPVPELRVVVAGQPDNWASATKPLVNEQGQPLPDDGRRTIYIPKGQNISFATAAALKEISPQGGPLADLEVGGQYAVLYEKDIPTQNGNPARGHVVRYKAPAPNSGGFFGGQQQGQPAQQPQATAQAQQQAWGGQQQAAAPQQGWQQPQTQPQPGGWPQGQQAPAQNVAQTPQFQQQAAQQGFQAPAAQQQPTDWPQQGQQAAQQPQQGWAPGQVSENPPF
jgi:hypothetical protein